MARSGSFAGNPKVISAAAVQTLIWTSSEIDSTGVIEFNIAFQGSGGGSPVYNTLNETDRVRVRAAGRLIVDVPLAVLQAYTGAYSRANYAPADSATANGVLTIPLNLLDGPTMEACDQCQFPPGAEAQVELVTTSSVVAGAAILSWKTSNQVPRYFPRLLSSSANWAAANARGQRYNFSEDGIVRSVATTIAGIDRIECYISGQRAFNIPGVGYQGNLVAGGLANQFANLQVEKDIMEEGALVGTYRFMKTDLLLPGAAGSTYVAADTTSNYAGTAAEVATYAIVPVGAFRGN
jgi:hypothetical protein